MGSGIKVQAVPIRLRADDMRNLGFEANHNSSQALLRTDCFSPSSTSSNFNRVA